MTRNYSATQYNVHIPDSFEVSKHAFADVIFWIRRHYPDSEVWNRSMRSLLAEWAVHNALYALGVKRERTKDVDLNANQPWYVCAAYYIGGALVWPFIK